MGKHLQQTFGNPLQDTIDDKRQKYTCTYDYVALHANEL